ncbi:type VI secretion system-associated protein VasI [Motilimonas sp. E26]|uniref:type VI secretion system-associated protein VasI n=1 Tax=Motilimonas sp. E26 TaxID=2865674 RepID=UPI001E31C47B|nr:type VI secretion system-associated protein VasI [Motilimonas sp. E26]MCE0559226.1 type VI secretion system-associated protein TagO [Motilimonas sp. E26]
MNKTLAFILGCISISSAFAQVEDAPQQIEQAKQCTEISSRLERLACFDRLFNTATATLSENTPTPGAHLSLPGQWQRMQEIESYRNGSVAFLYQSAPRTAELSDHWLAAPAIGSTEPRPVMLLSCLNKISRVELYFAKPISGNQINVTIKGKHTNSQLWQLDDTGRMLRSGRGLPAIEVMKAMLSPAGFALRSDHPDVNGLHFSGETIKELIAPLRATCRW